MEVVALKPHPYQQDCLDALDAARRERRKRALVVMATGLGKTVVSAFEIKRLLERAPGRVLYLCHNNDILRQARKTFEEMLGGSYTFGYFHGTEKHMHEVDLLFASFQTMVTWREAFLRDEFRYIVVDETHHAHAATFRPTVEYFEPGWMIGLTATPERGDGLDITKIFGQPVFNLGLFEALARRYLCGVDYRLMTDEIQNAGVLDTPAGRLSIAELNRTVFIPKRDEEIVRIIADKVAEVENPRVMIFCTSIEHAERMAALMPHAVVVHSKLKYDEKQRRIAAFRCGDADTVITVDMFNEGIDIPEANVLVFLRSTASKTIYRQQLGRGLRKMLGKLMVLVLDFVANCERIEMIDELRTGVDDEYKRVPTCPGPGEEPDDEEEDVERERPAPFILTLDGIEFDERLLKLFDTIKSAREGYTVEILTAQLLRKADELGSSPRQDDVEADPDMAASNTFYRIFQKPTWGEILEVVGLPVNRRHNLNVVGLRTQLLDMAHGLGRTPTVVDVNRDPAMPDLRALIRAFGVSTWNQVLREVGLTPNKSDSFTTSEVAAQLLAKKIELGRAPTGPEIDADPNMASTAAIRATFGKPLNQVLREVLATHIRLRRDYTQTELRAQLLSKARELGRTPTGRDIKADPNMAATNTFVKVFGVDTLSEVMEVVGLTPTRKSRKQK